MSPTSQRESHGDRFDATRVRTRRLWWRPMVLNVSVGHSSSMERMSPNGTRPNFDERLEAVTDAQHEAVAVLQQVAHRFGDVPERGRTR